MLIFRLSIYEVAEKQMQEFDLYHFFYSPANILSTLVFLTVILIWTYFRSNAISDKKEASIYRLNVYYKLFFSLIFAVYYIAVFQGGDTLAYWQTMDALENLMFQNFSDFWEIITSESTMERLRGLFNYKTGYPPRFIYIEEESFFVAKVLLIFRLITFNSYLATTFLVSFIMANASWKLYTLARETGIFQRKLLIITVLFLPSVAFWCSGISKDAIVYIAILYMVYYLACIFKKGLFSFNFKYIVLFLIASWFLYQARPFILYAMLIPLSLMYGIGVMNKIRSFGILRVFIKALLSVGVGVVFAYIFTSVNLEEILTANELFSEAITIQQDFQGNTTVYGEGEGKRYSLGEIDYTLAGIVKVIPMVIVTGLYRPFIWEALSPSLIFNGFESIFFILLTFWFFFVKLKSRIQAIMTNELLLFALCFIFIMAFMVGFTSILFGVLVRVRAPLLPFLGLLLSIDYKAYLSSLKAPLQLNES